MNYIQNYIKQGTEYKLAVDCWEAKKHYTTYCSRCNLKGVTPIERKMFHKVIKDCSREVEILKREKRKIEAIANERSRESSVFNVANGYA